MLFEQFHLVSVFCSVYSIVLGGEVRVLYDNRFCGGRLGRPVQMEVLLCDVVFSIEGPCMSDIGALMRTILLWGLP